jgi:hypothetical protein
MTSSIQLKVVWSVVTNDAMVSHCGSFAIDREPLCCMYHEDNFQSNPKLNDIENPAWNHDRILFALKMRDSCIPHGVLNIRFPQSAPFSCYARSREAVT